MKIKITIITSLLTLLALLTFAERRALRVLPSEALAAIELERLAGQRRQITVVTNWSAASALAREITMLRSNAAVIAKSRIAYEDYALAREGGTNTTADIQTARYKILEVQHVND